MVVVEGFADGFWPERWSGEERGERKHGERIKGAEDVGLREVMGMMESLRKDLGAIIVLTLQGLWVSGILEELTKAVEWIVQSASTSAVFRALWTGQGRSAKGLATEHSNHTNRTGRFPSEPGRHYPGRCAASHECG